MGQSSQKPTLLVIAAGGTISIVRDPQTGKSVPTYTAVDLLAQSSLATIIEPRCVDVKPVRRVEDLCAVAHCIKREVQTGVKGVVVTHGTDTLEEVAYFIDEVVPTDVPIVCTGAMRPSWAAGYDGIRNLENAIRLVMTVTAEFGVLV